MQAVIPHLALSDAAGAIEFYKKALAAEEVMRMPMPGSGKIMHAELKIGGASVFLADVMSEAGRCKSPQQLGGTTVTLHIVSPDVDKTIATAAAAGGKVTMPPEDMFWGDRYGQFQDPYGHVWSVSTPKVKLTPEQMKAAAAEAMAKWGKK